MENSGRPPLRHKAQEKLKKSEVATSALKGSSELGPRTEEQAWPKTSPRNVSRKCVAATATIHFALNAREWAAEIRCQHLIIESSESQTDKTANYLQPTVYQRAALSFTGFDGQTLILWPVFHPLPTVSSCILLPSRAYNFSQDSWSW